MDKVKSRQKWKLSSTQISDLNKEQKVIIDLGDTYKLEIIVFLIRLKLCLEAK